MSDRERRALLARLGDRALGAAPGERWWVAFDGPPPGDLPPEVEAVPLDDPRLLPPAEAPKGWLDRLHQGIERRLALHMHALLDRRVAAARRSFAGFAVALVDHADREEAHLLPLYAARVETPPRGGHADHFVAEHGRLRAFLAELEARLAALSTDPTNAELLALLDRELRLRGILEHHELRETELLLPALTESCAPGDLLELERRLTG